MANHTSEGLAGFVWSNPRTKILSALLALSAWSYVQGDEVHERMVKATVQWKLPAKLVTTEALPSSVTLTVRGTRTATRRAREVVARLPVDISDIGIGEHGLDFASFQPTGVPPSVSVVAVSPSSIRFVLDEVAVRKVTVRPVLVGEPNPSHEIREVSPDPPVVDVRGPRSTVASLREVATQPIDVSGLVEDTISEVDLDLPRGVSLAGDVVPTATIRLIHKIDRREVSGVPVYVWGQPDYHPEIQDVVVTLQGTTEGLDAIDAETVVALVHLPDGADRDRYEAWFGPQEGVRMKIVHPGGQDVEVVSVEPASVVVEGP